MDDEIKNLQERFGPKGLRELAQLDNMGMSLLNRLYLVTSIAKNLKEFNQELGDQFYQQQSGRINYLVKDIEKFTVAFQNKRGEI